ncbi:hypothetical protein A4G17_01765 [Frederiksenia canicola]|uniref:Uncharacterized protein n=1 Tax=Frederiksenia canicola TaxID=123824 RepID=A0AAE6X485_9PAST|nr:hypothetical protein A4G17_01765 [Frederiksenia canicola]RPE93813.1 hypothetical protein EDC49_1327 [Frederiksenia canicola]
MLVNAEKEKGFPLTQEEVMKIAEDCTCIRMNYSDFIELSENRGYQDISPEYAWEDWLAIKEFIVN